MQQFTFCVNISVYMLWIYDFTWYVIMCLHLHQFTCCVNVSLTWVNLLDYSCFSISIYLHAVSIYRMTCCINISVFKQCQGIGLHAVSICRFIRICVNLSFYFMCPWNHMLIFVTDWYLRISYYPGSAVTAANWMVMTALICLLWRMRSLVPFVMWLCPVYFLQCSITFLTKHFKF
jgi:hypothetical protein